jgi:hypothetical protein
VIVQRQHQQIVNTKAFRPGLRMLGACRSGMLFHFTRLAMPVLRSAIRGRRLIV